MAADRPSSYDREQYRGQEMVRSYRSISESMAAGSLTSQFLSDWAIQLLGATIGFVYVWFGVLKIFGVSPISELVGRMSAGIPRDTFVRFVGVWEVVVGIAFLFRLASRMTLPLFFLHLAGTFLTFVFQPQEAYRKGNPLILTQVGEFIVKNIVLLAAGLVVGTSVRHDAKQIN